MSGEDFHTQLRRIREQLGSSSRSPGDTQRQQAPITSSVDKQHNSANSIEHIIQHQAVVLQQAPIRTDEPKHRLSNTVAARYVMNLVLENRYLDAGKFVASTQVSSLALTKEFNGWPSANTLIADLKSNDKSILAELEKSHHAREADDLFMKTQVVSNIGGKPYGSDQREPGAVIPTGNRTKESEIVKDKYIYASETRGANDRRPGPCTTWSPPAEASDLSNIHYVSKGESNTVRLRETVIQRFVDLYQQGGLADLDTLFRSGELTGLPVTDFVELKMPLLRNSLATIGMTLDEEQERASARPEARLQIKARAGSGKTRTLSARAALAIHDEKLDPNQVLILAFNKAAATEVGVRAYSGERDH